MLPRARHALHAAQEAPPHRRAHPRRVIGAVQPLRRTQRQHDVDLGRAEDQPGQPVLPLPGQGRADQRPVWPVRKGAGRDPAGRRQRAQRGRCLALLPHAVRDHLGLPLSLPRPERSSVQEPPSRDPIPACTQGQGPRSAGLAGRLGTRRLDQHRCARGRAGGHRDGGRADLLAQLRVRARPAPRARARDRRAGAGARGLPCAP